MNSLPRLGERSRRGQQRLREIAGVVPSIQAYPAGCRFNPRCSAATDACRAEVPGVPGLDHVVLFVSAQSMLRPKGGGQVDSRQAGQGIERMSKILGH